MGMPTQIDSPPRIIEKPPVYSDLTMAQSLYWG